MKIYLPKSCANCQETYTPTGPNSRFCSRTCKSKDSWQKERKRREDSGITMQSQGGNYGRTGKDHWAYRNGIGVFKKQLSPQIRLEVKFCERCALDLSNAKNGFWVVHHRDHNRSNNERDNLELLCKRCHQRHHRCGDNLPKPSPGITL
jgi:hypothetical protein